MIERVYESLFHFCRLLGEASDGARVVERDGVVAAVVPAASERSVVNSAVFRTPAALEAAYDELAGAYREIGAKWTVWVPPGGDGAARFLERRGHYLDAEPAAMARELDGVERPPEGALPDWTSEGDIAEVGPLNDRAYKLDTDSFTRALSRWPDGAAHVYTVRDGGTPVACLLMTDHAGNTDVEMVAVAPEARGRGISGKLLAHALADAAERGNESATLVATRLGLPVYERLGFRAFGHIEMWERAPG